MRITRLELREYNRLSLNNITRFVYTPESDYQLILGTNGSGKSSVLYELSPLPAHSSNYGKEGLKDLTIEHRGSVYRLISDMKTGKHSFTVDGDEDLNKGGTQSNQMALVEQHFNGYNRDLHDILTDEETFTSMDTNNRRKWITALSTQNYGFALALHKRLASAARDHVGAVKHLNNRLAENQNNLKQLGSVDGLEERALQLREELNALLLAQSADTQSVQETENALRELLQRIGTMAKSVVDRIHQIRYSGPTPLTSIEDVETFNALAQQDVVEKRVLTDRMAAEYNELETAIHGFRTSDGITPENIENHLLELRDRIAELRQLQDGHFGELADAELIAIDNQNALPQLGALFLQLPDNQDRRFSRQTIDEKRKEHSVVLERYSHLDGRLLAANRRINAIEAAVETTCPSCTFMWREGVEPGELELLIGTRTQMAQQMETILAQRKQLETFLDEAQEVGALYNEFRALTSSYPRLRPLWSHIASQQLNLINPPSQVGVFNRWSQAVSKARELQALERREVQLSQLAEQWADAGGVSHLGQRMAAIARSIETETVELNAKRAIASRASDYLGSIRNLENLVGQLGMLSDQIERRHSNVIDAYRDRAIESVKYGHHNELASIQRRLTEHNTLQGVVSDLARDVESTEKNRDVLLLLAKALSPTDGLIAEQLTGFINCLTAQMNSILATIWTYDLIIHGCGLENGGLDYKFPLSSRGDKPRPDVVKGSKAQKQVINLSFKLTVMLYLGMEDYPLFLDEPGEGFDEQHRTNLMSFVKQLMDGRHHSQMFMVSHYASTHGSFTQAETVVLDDSNIAVAGKYNENVVLG